MSDSERMKEIREAGEKISRDIRESTNITERDLSLRVGPMTDAAELSGSRPTAPEPSEAAIRAAAREVRFRDGFGYDDLVRQMLRAAYAVDALGGSPHPPAGDTEAERRRLWEAIQSLRSPDFGDMAVIDARARLVDQRINELVRAALRGGSHQPEEGK